MKKAEFMYLFLVIIAAEFVFIFPSLFPRNQDQTKAMASSSSGLPAHEVDAPPAVQAPVQTQGPAQAPPKQPAPRPASSLVATRPTRRALPAPRPRASAERAPDSAVLASQLRTLALAPAAPQPRASRRVLRISNPPATARPSLTLAAAPIEKPEPKAAPKPQDSKPPALREAALKIAAIPLENRVTRPFTRTASADIFEFDATATQLFRGQRTFLCAGVASGVKASITGVGRVPAGVSSCHRIAPQRTTTYVLHVAAAGASAERAVTVNVNPPSWRPQKSTQPRRHRFDVPPGYIITLP